MSALEGALVRLVAVLDGERVAYVLIGGMANAVWGEPRSTLDVDVSVWVEEPQMPVVVAALSDAFTPLPADPLTFVRETRVLPVRASDGVRLDIIFALAPFEHEAIQRGIATRIGGATVQVCTPEDLVLMKITSDRERDRLDARGVTLRNYDRLDLAYLEPRIRSLAELLETPDAAKLWQSWKREIAARKSPPPAR